MSAEIGSNQAVLIALIGLIASIATAVLSYWGLRGKADKEEALENQRKYLELKGAIDLINQKLILQLDPITEVLENELPKLLIREDTPEMDALIQKFTLKTLSNEEAKKLLSYIDEEWDKTVKDESRDKGTGVALAFVRAVLKSKLKVNG